MRSVLMRALGWRLVAALTVTIASCALMAFVDLPKSRAERRLAARDIWMAQPLTRYRMVIQATFSGRACVQEIEVRDRVLYAARDTCGSPWLASLTIDRLFELSTRLESAPDCFPSQRNCLCHRVRVGAVQYDPDLGFPTSIVWRRELRPNWQDPAYWLHAWEARALPKCTMPMRPLRLDVVSLNSLE